MNAPDVSDQSQSRVNDKTREVKKEHLRNQKSGSRRDHSRSSRARHQDTRTSSTIHPANEPRSSDLYCDRHPRRGLDRSDRDFEDRSRRHRESNVSDPYDHATDLYAIDTKGDLANLEYRRPNKWTVPLYHLYGSGSIVGLDPMIKIDRNLSDERGYTLRYPPRSQLQKVIESIEPDDAFATARASSKIDEGERLPRTEGQIEKSDSLPITEQSRETGECYHPRLFR